MGASGQSVRMASLNQTLVRDNYFLWWVGDQSETKSRPPWIKLRCPGIKSRRTSQTTWDCVNLGLRRPQKPETGKLVGRHEKWIDYDCGKY